MAVANLGIELSECLMKFGIRII